MRAEVKITDIVLENSFLIFFYKEVNLLHYYLFQWSPEGNRNVAQGVDNVSAA